MTKRLGIFLITMLLSITPVAGEVEQARETDRHTIYYNVLPTSALPEAMARAYGITRSDTRVLLNITVREREEDRTIPVSARINAQAVNLNGQLKRFSMREISEEDAIYYIGDVGVNRGEILNFTLRVAPEGERREEVIEFQRAF
ncbi:hypothetical protein J2T60_002391 [Natronospira proteinivora]|uniref:DUF4426 domain-containing protein n=1 Tax=Natronospira proteinivora TaxID=1807133 RepID=A0ABT1GAN2_9GAMM|nr:DUF4426 domain-containing protein [Natronospira proteinivora]MCP1728391.1 hypothetical protein [Natronospira proteinivora]